jgi:hypothetical protein
MLLAANEGNMTMTATLRWTPAACCGTAKAAAAGSNAMLAGGESTESSGAGTVYYVSRRTCIFN